MEATIRIEGMHCDGCAGRVRRVLEREPGIREAHVTHDEGRARVKYNESLVTVERLKTLVETAGYTASVVEEDS